MSSPRCLTTSTSPFLPALFLSSYLQCHSEAFTDMIAMLDKRLNDKGKYWRHVYKVRILRTSPPAFNPQVPPMLTNHFSPSPYSNTSCTVVRPKSRSTSVTTFISSRHSPSSNTSMTVAVTLAQTSVPVPASSHAY
jgi:ENTH domain